MPNFKKSATAICFSVLLVTGCSKNQSKVDTTPSSEGEVQSQEENTNIKVKESVNQLGNSRFSELESIDVVDIGERIIDDKIYTYVLFIGSDGKGEDIRTYYLSICDGKKWTVMDKKVAEAEYDSGYGREYFKEGIEIVGPFLVATVNKDSRIYGEGDPEYEDFPPIYVDKTLHFINEKGEVETDEGIPYYDNEYSNKEFGEGDRIINTSRGLALLKSGEKHFEAINLQSGSTVKINKNAEIDEEGVIQYINYEENIVLFDVPAPEATGQSDNVYIPYDYKKQEVMYDNNGQTSIYLPQPENQYSQYLIGSSKGIYYYLFEDESSLFSSSLQNPAPIYETTLGILPSEDELLSIHQSNQEIRLYNLTEYKGVPSIQMITLEK
ncbi:hypothetical protein U2I54_18785 [Bacillus pseudomycoides]|uniref:Lipoprotein n=1 Tax=Bacillus bingmayongensis TaxID=1150157 RepID=A0ABU5K001_9BACI|nr:hypothetical protein [Bacillus pseudomycoides]